MPLGDCTGNVVHKKTMDNQLTPSQQQFWSLLAKKLAKEASEKELADLTTLLLNNPELQHQAELLTEMWRQEPKKNNPESEAAYIRHLVKYKNEFFQEDSLSEMQEDEPGAEEKPSFFRGLFTHKTRLALSMAAMLVIVAGLYFLFIQKNNTGTVSPQAISSVVTKNGNRTKVVLPDGSQVWLNAGSNLEYNNLVFNEKLREVSLNGEAYFDVVKNTDKPFIIHTRKMDIKVLGTAFNVRSYNNEKTAEASLIRGLIEVTLKDRKDQKIILKPNEKISISTEEKATVPDKSPVIKHKTSPAPQIVIKELQPNPLNNIIGEIAWTQNKLYFDAESLEEISLMLERWFGKKVVIQNEVLKTVRYTGNFESESLEEVLAYLKLSKPFNFRIENDTVFIY